MAKAKSPDTPQMVVQGAWISKDEQDLLKQEVKDKKLKSITFLASKIIRNWCNKKRGREDKTTRK